MGIIMNTKDKFKNNKDNNNLKINFLIKHKMIKILKIT